MAFNNINKTVIQPNYNRDQLQEKIIHLGLGAFHRGHQAFILNQLHQIETNDWGICAINLFDDGSHIVSKLKQQDYLYTLLEQDSDTVRTYRIASIINALQRQEGHSQIIIDKIGEPQVSIVTLTITEKGYCTLPGGRVIDWHNPLIQEDLEHLDNPKTAPAILYKALKLRHKRNLPTLTLLSCDNMPENGYALKNSVLGFTQKVDPEFALWIEANISFPSSMVDRIVPAVTNETLATIEQYAGIKDPCGIATESFLQWVIEDNFTGERPQWEKIAGVTMVNDVVPFEEMKLRMLNGSHSFLAYLGNLAGCEHISDCMQNPTIKKAALDLMLNEQAITLKTEGVNLTEYANQLIKRFENTALKHKTVQIAMDGTQKIPQRLLDSIRWHIKQNMDYPLLALGVAGWMAYVSQHSGNVNDPLKDELIILCQTSAEGSARIDAFLTLSNVFSKDLTNNATFVAKIKTAYLNIIEIGALKAIEKLVFTN